MPAFELVGPFRMLLIAFVLISFGCVKKTEKATDTSATTPDVASFNSVPKDTEVANVIVPTSVDDKREVQFAQVFSSGADGWKTESFTLEADAQLKHLSKLFLLMTVRASSPGANEMDSSKSKLASLVVPVYRGSRLRPESLNTVFNDRSLTVRRPTVESKALPEDSVTGLAGFSKSLQSLADVLAHAKNVHIKFKIVHVSMSVDSVDTTVLFEVSGSHLDGATQINAKWQVSWHSDAAETGPKIARIELADYEELVRIKRPMFDDRTESVIGLETAYRTQLRPGIEYWRERIPQHLGIYYFGHHGLAVGDANGDGLDDVYVCQPGGLPNRLFMHASDGTAYDASGDAGVDVLNNSRSALFVDMDNDGDSDLIVTATDRVIVFDNDGSGKFRMAKTLVDVRGGYTTSAVDYDSDGLLDLYVCVYLNHATNEGRLPFPVPYHDANNGGKNVLLRNDGNWSFTDVTEQVGLDENNSRFSYVGTWEDFDRDGDMDLYVANDFGRNCLYRNSEGRFQNVASEIGLEDTGFGMSATWGDFNGDGLMDLYVGNMFSGAGNRIAFQSRFQKDASPETRRKLQRSARGNSLYQNLGDGTFRDVSIPAAVTMGRWSWGTLFVDLNNNGWQDLVVMNGMVTGQSSADL